MIITEYFSDKELACPCCGALPLQKSVDRLYALRIISGVPIYLNSACRCIKYNKKVRGSVGSIHIPPKARTGQTMNWGGGAYDINERTWEKKLSKVEFIELARMVGFMGFGVYPSFLHIDDAKRPIPTIWTGE